MAVLSDSVALVDAVSVVGWLQELTAIAIATARSVYNSVEIFIVGGI